MTILVEKLMLVLHLNGSHLEIEFAKSRYLKGINHR